MTALAPATWPSGKPSGFWPGGRGTRILSTILGSIPTVDKPVSALPTLESLHPPRSRSSKTKPFPGPRGKLSILYTLSQKRLRVVSIAPSPEHLAWACRESLLFWNPRWGRVSLRTVDNATINYSAIICMQLDFTCAI